MGAANRRQQPSQRHPAVRSISFALGSQDGAPIRVSIIALMARFDDFSPLALQVSSPGFVLGYQSARGSGQEDPSAR